MTDQEFRHLSRAALVEIIYELQRTVGALRAELSVAQEKLEERYIALSEVGNLADAAVRLNGLMEAAQRAAEDYLLQVRRLSDAEILERCEQIRAGQQADGETVNDDGKTETAVH